MKITPLEIRQHEFEKTFRGYNIEEVDNFLSNISQEWERVLNDSKMLRMQLEIAEKEANKLREIEMTLFKTLKTAEDTSTMITEQANQQADKHIQEARLKGEQVVIDAQQKAHAIIRQAEDKAKYIKEEVLGEVKVLERDFKAMDHYKTNLLVQMRSLANASLDHVQRFEQKFDKEGIEARFEEASSMLSDVAEIPAPAAVVTSVVENIEPVEAEVSAVEALAEEVSNQVEITVEETTENVVENVSEVATEVKEETVEIIENVVESSEETVEEITESVDEVVNTPIAEVNNFVENTFFEPISKQEEKDKTDDLAIIEGIGPKIAMILFDNGIFTFRQLATTPVYKIKEMLDAEGSHFSMHDPSTWVQQALLAAEERWNDLFILQEKLKGGREVEEETIAETTVEVVETPIVETIKEVETPIAVVEETIETPVIEKADIFANDDEIQHLDSILHKPAEVVEAPKAATENNLDAITEEMLEKVNKVKLAIRKAMVEKSESQVRDNSPLPTVNDVMAKNAEAGGSFFDNI